MGIVSKGIKGTHGETLADRKEHWGDDIALEAVVEVMAKVDPVVGWRGRSGSKPQGDEYFVQHEPFGTIYIKEIVNDGAD